MHNATTFERYQIFAVERIRQLKITDSPFEYPGDFDADETLDSSFDIVYDEPLETKIWFSANQARYIKERRWAREQSITEQDDGSIILEMKTSGWWDVKRWVMGYGADAKVLEPEELKEEILNDLNSARSNYA